MPSRRTVLAGTGTSLAGLAGLARLGDVRAPMSDAGYHRWFVLDLARTQYFVRPDELLRRRDALHPRVFRILADRALVGDDPATRALADLADPGVVFDGYHVVPHAETRERAVERLRATGYRRIDVPGVDPFVAVGRDPYVVLVGEQVAVATTPNFLDLDAIADRHGESLRRMARTYRELPVSRGSRPRSHRLALRAVGEHSVVTADLRAEPQTDPGHSLAKGELARVSGWNLGRDRVSLRSAHAYSTGVPSVNVADAPGYADYDRVDATASAQRGLLRVEGEIGAPDFDLLRTGNPPPLVEWRFERRGTTLVVTNAGEETVPVEPLVVASSPRTDPGVEYPGDVLAPGESFRVSVADVPDDGLVLVRWRWNATPVTLVTYDLGTGETR